MKIGINAAWMTPGQAGGMEWYARNLIRRLYQDDQANEYVLVTSPINDNVFSQEVGTEWERIVHSGSDVSPDTYRRELSIEANDDLLGPKLQKSGVDLLWCPFMYSLPEVKELRSVVTIPDLQHEHLPELFNPHELGSRLLGFHRSMERSGSVMAISTAVKTDIIATYPDLDAKKVFSTPLGLNEDCRDVDQAQADQLALATAIRHRLDFPFVYYPANAWPHKNHQALLEALALARSRGSEIQLVLSGSADSFTDTYAPVVDSLGLADVVHHLGYLSREEVFGLFRRSHGLIFPSKFEGFGLPILEALHLGVPVACSDLPALREVGADAVRLFDPASVEQIADAIVDLGERSIHVDPALYQRQLQQFDYKKTATATLEAFDYAMSSGLGKADSPGVPLPHSAQEQGAAALLPVSLRSPQSVVVRCHRRPEPEPATGLSSLALALDGVVVVHDLVPGTDSQRLEGTTHAAGMATIANSPLPTGPATRELAIELIRPDGTVATDIIVDECFVSDAHYGLVRIV